MLVDVKWGILPNWENWLQAMSPAASSHSSTGRVAESTQGTGEEAADLPRIQTTSTPHCRGQRIDSEPG